MCCALMQYWVSLITGLDFPLECETGLECGTGMWDWNVGLECGTGMWDWNVGLECGTGMWSGHY